MMPTEHFSDGSGITAILLTAGSPLLQYSA